MSDPKNAMSRRRFLTLAGTSFAAAEASSFLPGGSGFLTRNAKADSAKYTLRFGATVINRTNELHVGTGFYHFVEQAQKLSDGELKIEVIDSAQACAENTCGDRVANGIYEIGGSSPQNLGSVFPYAIALDWPMLWERREEYLNFLFSPQSNELYRDVLRKRYGIIPLYGSGEMRSILMGLPYRDADPIRTPEQLRGSKVRITNSEMIAGFASSLNMEPIPLAWTELLEGLRSGVVDATETWPGAATGFGMHSVLSQDVAVNFCPGFELVFISARTYDGLPDRIKEALLEAAYQAMIYGYGAVEEAQNEVVGNGPQPSDSSVYAESDLRLITLTSEEKEAFREAAGVAFNEDTYKSVRERLAREAGTDVFDALRDYQASVAGQPLKPQRWWV